jgi:hypothetical protein
MHEPPKVEVKNAPIANGRRLLLRAMRDRRPVFALRSLALVTCGVVGLCGDLLFALLALTVGMVAQGVLWTLEAYSDFGERHGDNTGYAIFMRFGCSSRAFARWVRRQVEYDEATNGHVWRTLGDRGPDEAPTVEIRRVKRDDAAGSGGG